MTANKDLNVVLGAGPVGLTLARQLAADGKPVRVVTRSSEPPLPAGAVLVHAAVNQRDEAIRACAGAGVVYGCVGGDYRDWKDRWPPLMEAMLHGAGSAGARFVFMDNLYMYGPQDEPLREDMPLTAYGVKPVVRAQITRMWRAAHERGDVRAAAVRASDFYGPLVHNAALGDFVIGRAINGKSAQLVGDIDQPHALAYVPDIARALRTIGDAGDNAYGQAWHVPHAPPITMRRAATRVFELLGRKPKLLVAPSWMLAIAGLFDANMREMREMLYQWNHPWRVDHSKFAEAFWGDFTPLEDGLHETVEWWKSSEAAA